jgi:hypothetical protein
MVQAYRRDRPSVHGEISTAAKDGHATDMGPFLREIGSPARAIWCKMIVENVSRPIASLSCLSVALIAACVPLAKPKKVSTCAALDNCRDDPDGASASGGSMGTIGGTVASAGIVAVTGGTLSTGGTGVGTGGTVSSGRVATGGSRSAGGTISEVGGSVADGGGISSRGGTTTGGSVTRTGGTTSTGGTVAGGTVSSGGTNAATGGTTSTGGTVAGGTVSTGGTNAATGGTILTGGTISGGTVSTGGTKSTTGGVSGTGGVVSTGGTVATGGTSSIPPAITLPGSACTTEAKDAACTGSAVCYKFCGPESQGYKALTCNGSKVVEGTCTFSSTANYACYSLTSVATCGATPPTASTACSISTCKPCGSSTDTGYYDSSSAAKVGYCVCTGSGKWSCASTGAWPCPSRTGC